MVYYFNKGLKKANMDTHLKSQVVILNLILKKIQTQKCADAYGTEGPHSSATLFVQVIRWE